MATCYQPEATTMERKKERTTWPTYIARSAISIIAPLFYFACLITECHTCIAQNLIKLV